MTAGARFTARMSTLEFLDAQEPLDIVYENGVQVAAGPTFVPIATGTTGQAVRIVGTQGITTIYGLLICADQDISVAYNGSDQALNLDADGFHVLAGTSVTAVAITNNSGFTAICAIWLVGNHEQLTSLLSSVGAFLLAGQAVTLTLVQTGCARILTAIGSTDFAVCYDLDEAAGAQRVDDVAGKELTPVSTVSQVAGKINFAASFNGTSSYLHAVGAGNIVTITPPFTLSCWVKIDAYPTGPAVASYALVVKANSLAAGQYQFYLIVRNDDHKVEMSVDGGSNGVVSATALISLSTWHLIVGWHTGTPNGGTVNLQIDNSTIYSAAGGGFGTSLAKFSLGATEAPVDYWLNGVLDQVMLWNRVLTQAERDVIWNGGAG